MYAKSIQESGGTWVEGSKVKRKPEHVAYTMME